MRVMRSKSSTVRMVSLATFSHQREGLTKGELGSNADVCQAPNEYGPAVASLKDDVYGVTGQWAIVVGKLSDQSRPLCKATCEAEDEAWTCIVKTILVLVAPSPSNTKRRQRSHTAKQGDMQAIYECMINTIGVLVCMEPLRVLEGPNSVE